MLPDPLEEETQRRQWQKIWDENPNADPIKVMATMVAFVWLSGMIMCAVLLVVAAIAWFVGVL